jgi:hypothetical protein
MTIRIGITITINIIMAIGIITITIELTIGTHCCARMTPSHTGRPTLVGKARQTGMDGPVSCSALTLQREEHLIIN